jgi:hypothetical protein
MERTNRRQFMAGMAAFLGLTKVIRTVEAAQGVQTEQAAEAKRNVLPFVPGSWTLVVLPDTQNYSTYYPGLFNLQTQWIVDNKDRYNIVYVLQLGDITNLNSEIEWERASRAMARLEGLLPYALVLGNHDYGEGGEASDRTTLINNYFPPGRFENWPTFGGTMKKGRIENNYHLFKASSRDWLILGLEWGPRDNTLQWANQILTKYHNHRAIIITHAYLYDDSTRYDWGTKGESQSWSPYVYGTAADTNDGEEMWNKLVKRHRNIFAVINGHVLHDGLGFLTSKGDAGNPVHQMLVNFQMRKIGGQSWLRLIEFLPDGKTVQIKTYCPLLETYETGPQSQFVIQTQL